VKINLCCLEENEEPYNAFKMISFAYSIVFAENFKSEDFLLQFLSRQTLESFSILEAIIFTT
jgi:hypothetical protein